MHSAQIFVFCLVALHIIMQLFQQIVSDSCSLLTEISNTFQKDPKGFIIHYAHIL